VSVFWRSKPVVEARAAFRPPPYTTATGATYRDVNLSALETSLQSVAVRSSVDLLCSLGSELPGDVFRGVGADRVSVQMPTYLEDPGGDGNGLADWCYQVLESWALRGNLYGDVLQRERGRPIQISLHYPDDVSGFLEDGKVKWRVNGEPVDPSRFIHRRVNPVPGRILGLSPIEFHATTLGLSLVSSRFGVQWFLDGAHPTGMLSNTEVELDDTQVRVAKQRFLDSIRGTREPLVYGKGWEFTPLSITAEESQFLKTQEFSAADCCRMFGPGFAEILGYETGGAMTYSNIESRSVHLLVYSTNKWLRRLERLVTSMLPRPQYYRLDRDAVLQSTTLDRYKAHELALKNRWKVPNEVRDDEDMRPVPWGNEPNASSPNAQSEPEEPTGAESPVPGGNA